MCKDLCEDLPPLYIDRQQMRQVFLNLFLNALDAMSDRGGALLVKTEAYTSGDAPWVQVSIRDTGTGIAADDLEHIFDPSLTTKHQSEEREGTGLCLTIVRQIIREHHGRIQVHSRLGECTTFSVHLPGRAVLRGGYQEWGDHEKAYLIGG